MSEAMRTPGMPLFSDAESTRKKAIATVVKLAGDNAGAGYDWILGASRWLKRQTCWRVNIQYNVVRIKQRFW